MLRSTAVFIAVALIAKSALASSPVVPLQPFTLDAPPTRRAMASRALSVASPRIVRAELVRAHDATALPGGPIHLAYYVPRATPTIDPREEDASSDDSQPERNDIDIGGSHPMVPGNRALLRNGIAYAPANAPQSVKQAIWAVNSICDRPYIWGGGHSSFHDYGYDCSGTVSFALHYAGVLDRPLPSTDLLRFGEYGRGRWITIYSRNGHTFAVIAGLRLDTTDFQRGGNEGPRWHTDGRSTWGFEARHPYGM